MITINIKNSIAKKNVIRYIILIIIIIIHIDNIIVSISKYPLTLNSFKNNRYELVKIEMRLYIHLQNLS